MHRLPLRPDLPSFYTAHRRPHHYPGGGTLAVSMRLAGSVTRPVARKILKLQERYGNDVPAGVYWSATADERLAFRQYAAGQHDRRALNGPFHLHHNVAIRTLVHNSLLEEARRGGWEVLCFSLMPNHIHLVVRHTHLTRHMGTVLRLWKSYAARECNKILELEGQPFFEHENYDTVIKTVTDLRAHCRYTLYNPVYAGLSPTWREWPGNYCNAEVIQRIIAQTFNLTIVQ